MSAQARGKVSISADECKGCGLCVDSCPMKCLELLPGLNRHGVRPAHYKGEVCTGCGLCFYSCPEPGAMVVYRVVTPKPQMVAEVTSTPAV